ncbi:MAG: FixH family protein [Geminicoccaceae bacterium]|nr:FixH family protein [Geminicoccaceae bacterium]
MTVERERQRGWWIPWLFVGLFGVVLVANGTMIFYAANSWTGLATTGSYEKGLKYNENLAAAEAQDELGWDFALEVKLDRGLTGHLLVQLRDLEGQPLNDADIEVKFERPTHEGDDFSVVPAFVGQGRYEAEFTATMAGIWNTHTVIRRGDDFLVRDGRHVLR